MINTIKDKFEKINDIEVKIYTAIERNQKKLLNDIEDNQKNRLKENIRKEAINKKSNT